MNILAKITERIIEEQELIIGPIAWEEAQQVKGLSVNAATKKISFTTNNQGEAINELVRRYEQLFGRASLEVCRDAVKDLVADAPANQVPSLLK